MNDRQSIADAFEDFYEQLYQSTRVETSRKDEGEPQDSTFTMKELQLAIRSLKKGRCKEQAGIVVEMLKHSGIKMKQLLLDLFKELLKAQAAPPAVWKQAVITVIHKSGPTNLPQNYRPITVIPLLYKLFAKLLYSRLAPILERSQTSDQAGFRSGVSTVDHLFTFVSIGEKSSE